MIIFISGAFGCVVFGTVAISLGRDVGGRSLFYFPASGAVFLSPTSLSGPHLKL